MKLCLFLGTFCFAFFVSSCTSPTSTYTSQGKTDTLVIRDTVRIIQHDTIYAPRILSGTSTVISKTTIDSITDYTSLSGTRSHFIISTL